MVPPASTHLHLQPLTAENLAACAPLWGDGATYDADGLQAVLARLRSLLRAGRARGRVIVDDAGQPRAFGVGAFVVRDWADGVIATQRPQVGRQLLQSGDWARLVLDDEAVAHANAGPGLDLAVLNQGYDGAGGAAEWPILLGVMLQGFIDTHRGYRVRRVLNEAFGARAAEFATRSWSDVVRAEVSGPGGSVPSVCWTVTLETAERQGGTLLPLFVYRPPKLALTAAEQAVLQVAVAGATDPEIAQRLEVSIPALKARWTRMSPRAAARGVSGFASGPRESGKRGPQTRHLLVEFVRSHPAELTPYAWPTDAAPVSPARRPAAGSDQRRV